MPQDTLIPTPQTFSSEELNRRVELLVAELQKSKGCTDLAVNIVEAIVDPAHGGSDQNVARLLPQFFVARDASNYRYYDDRINLDGDLNPDGTPNVEIHEVEAFVLAAATLKSQGINLTDVVIDEDFINLAREKSREVQGICK